MNNVPTPALIYNLFPRLLKSIDDWSAQVDAIAKMSFNTIYVNPFHETGGSSSLYAVKDYYRLNPQLLSPGTASDDFSSMRKFLEHARAQGIDVYMDLVINHTANDSVLVTENPVWFKRDRSGNPVHPFAIDPADPSKITVWGDLAEINYEGNPDFEGLKRYWDNMIAFYQAMGFTGFRCDAAYKVPCAMWGSLISFAKARNPQARFLAETLGCRLEQASALSSCGFDYLFNSSKWWNFDSSWAIDQHRQFRTIAPSISFPESHDTIRVASQPPRNISMQKNRYLLSVVFSKGLLMPIGYEYGATKKLDVVRACPDDLNEKPWDLVEWIRKVNALKLNRDVLCEEGRFRVLSGYDWDLLFLMKEADNDSQSMGICINKDWYNGRVVRREEMPSDFGMYNSLIRPFIDPELKEKNRGSVALGPCEIILFS